jgi:hypothetical protein
MDSSSNVVKTATGSGTSLQYDWDGTDNNHQPVTAGAYYYYISAETNGESGNALLGNEKFSNLSSAANFADSPEWWAIPNDNSGDAAPFALYPPGIDTNGLIIFPASISEMRTVRPSLGKTASFEAKTASLDYSGPAYQAASAAPERSPGKPAIGTAGLFGIAYQDYFPEMLTIAAPPNGLLGKVQIQGSTQDTKLPFIESVGAENFIATMARGAWQPGFVKAHGQLKASDLRSASFGGANVFNNNVSFGLLSLHGAYGTSQDATTGANFAQQIYFPVDGRPNGAASYVRMSEMDLGSPGTNGLKWMVLACCNSLRQQNWSSIRNAGWKPFNQNLHILLGANLEMDAGNDIMFAKFMLGLDGNQRQTIIEAWRLSEPYCAHGPVSLAVAYYDDCEQDMLTGTNNYTPQGSIFYKSFPSQ